MKSFLFASLLIASLHASTITIAVAANVSFAIESLKTAFTKQYPNIHVSIILGSSGKLTAQISNGAPYGLFMSANMAYPNALYKQGIATTKPVVYAKGALALFSVRERDFSQGLTLLTDANIHKIAIANPLTAPYGQAAREALQNARLYQKLLPKFVYGESISQTFSYALHAADIGIVAQSLLYSPQMAHFQQNKNWVSVNKKLYIPIKQGIVLLKNVPNTKEYQKFYDFLLSKQAKMILQRYGYITQ